MITLRFLGSGKFQREDADLIGVTQPTVSRVLKDVIHAIAKLKPRFIKFPDVDEFRSIKDAFYAKKGIPGVIGAIDCTHIPIKKPSGDIAELYRNRKGFFSINVQVACDHRMNIRNIVASWMGSVHDSRIFSESRLKDHLETIPPEHRVHLLGDRGYPCQRYLLTPVARGNTQAERRFNFAHSSTRMVVERLFGVWKRKFPCLSQKLRLSTPEYSAVVIVACAVLHNLAIQRQEVDEEDLAVAVVSPDEEEVVIANLSTTTQGAAKRQAIIANYFS